MRIYTEIIYTWDEKKGELVEESSKSFEYKGEVALCHFSFTPHLHNPGGTTGDILGGGQDILDELGDIAGDIGDLGGDILDGDLDDTINDVLDDITDAAEGAIEDDPSSPQIVYSKNGKLAEVSPVTNVPVIYGTRKIRGISVYKELITES